MEIEAPKTPTPTNKPSSSPNPPSPQMPPLSPDSVTYSLHNINNRKNSTAHRNQQYLQIGAKIITIKSKALRIGSTANKQIKEQLAEEMSTQLCKLPPMDKNEFNNPRMYDRIQRGIDDFYNWYEEVVPPIKRKKPSPIPQASNKPTSQQQLNEIQPQQHMNLTQPPLHPQYKHGINQDIPKPLKDLNQADSHTKDFYRKYLLKIKNVSPNQAIIETNCVSHADVSRLIAAGMQRAYCYTPLRPSTNATHNYTKASYILQNCKASKEHDKRIRIRFQLDQLEYKNQKYPTFNIILYRTGTIQIQGKPNSTLALTRCIFALNNINNEEAYLCDEEKIMRETCDYLDRQQIHHQNKITPPEKKEKDQQLNQTMITQTNNPTNDRKKDIEDKQNPPTKRIARSMSGAAGRQFEQGHVTGIYAQQLTDLQQTTNRPKQNTKQTKQNDKQNLSHDLDTDSNSESELSISSTDPAIMFPEDEKKTAQLKANQIIEQQRNASTKTTKTHNIPPPSSPLQTKPAPYKPQTQSTDDKSYTSNQPLHQIIQSRNHL